jgi:hypothetical protein
VDCHIEERPLACRVRRVDGGAKHGRTNAATSTGRAREQPTHGGEPVTIQPGRILGGRASRVLRCIVQSDMPHD